MKRMIINLFAITTVLLLSSGQLLAQERLPYKSKAVFLSDTIQYLEYNFLARSSQYKGKKVSDVINDMEFPVLFIDNVVVKSDLQKRTTEVMSLSLVIHKVEDTPSELVDYYVQVWFVNPPAFADFRKLYDYENKKFTPQIYKFIKDLEVSRVASNEYIIMKRENDLKKAKAQED